MNVKIYCPDMSCDSCIQTICSALENTAGIESFVIRHDAVDISYDPSKINPEMLITKIQEKGYRAGLAPFERKTFKERLRDALTNKEKYDVEYRMFRYSALTFFILLLLEIGTYLALFDTHPAFLEIYGWWIFYITVAVVSIGSAMWHMKSYQATVTSMVGMMLGMTFGMQTGMMIGTIIGVSNGLFVGGMTGMIVAVGVGFYNGKRCGIMGVLEGMMAGVMGGVMGSMIGTMFRVDHILYFMPVFMAINIAVMWGLSYMLFEEVVENKPTTKKVPVKFARFFSYCLIVVSLLAALILYGPKTGLAALA
ncbi:heavy metal translocating P-type ATPase [Candidatus Woesearchaeota archaeon]|nr:heavy metal translocating P-type ATPase [Candidatus Woesearchaeota archaeon]